MSLIAGLALAAAAPAPADCQAMLGPLHEQPEVEALPNVVEGATLRDDAALVRLRKARGEEVLVIRGGSLEGAKLAGAKLRNICFLDTNLSGSDLSGADLTGSAFVETDLAGTDLGEARMTRILLRNANLKDAKAQGASMVGGRLDGGWFDGSVEGFRLDGANLTGFRFDCGIMLDDGCPVYQGGEYLSLRGANLTDSNLYAFAHLDGARIDRTRAALAALPELAAAKIAGPILVTGAEIEIALTPEEYRSLVPLFIESANEPAEAPAVPIAPGSRLFFVDHPSNLDDRFRDHPLYARLLPAVIGSASSRVAARVNADGSLDAAGDAWGANGHSCSLAADGLRFDPATGWYSGPHEAGEDDPPEWRGKPMPVLRFTRSGVEVWQSGKSNYGAGEGDPRISDYAGCGARAAFSPMQPVPVSPEEAESRLAAMEGEGAP